MIFSIIVYILGGLLVLNGFRLSYTGETLYSKMSQQEMLAVIANRINGAVHKCAGLIIIIIMAKG